MILGPKQPSIQQVTLDSSPFDQWSYCESGFSSPAYADFKKWCYISNPRIRLIRLHRDTFSFTFQIPVMRRLMAGIRPEKLVIRLFHRCADVNRVYLHKPRQYRLQLTQSINTLLLLGYKPVQQVTVLNTAGNCNAMVSIIILYYNITCNIIIL